MSAAASRRALASLLALGLVCGGALCVAQTDGFRAKPDVTTEATQCAKPKPVCIFDFVSARISLSITFLSTASDRASSRSRSSITDETLTFLPLLSLLHTQGPHLAYVVLLPLLRKARRQCSPSAGQVPRRRLRHRDSQRQHALVVRALLPQRQDPAVQKPPSNRYAKAFPLSLSTSLDRTLALALVRFSWLSENGANSPLQSIVCAVRSVGGLLFSFGACAEAVQTGHSYKTTTLNAVLRHYNASSEPQCAVFFDDLWSNKRYADATGVHFVKVNPDSGVSMSDVSKGLQAVKDSCTCGG